MYVQMHLEVRKSINFQIFLYDNLVPIFYGKYWFQNKTKTDDVTQWQTQIKFD